MDPDATWTALLEVYRTRDWLTVWELADALLNWLKHGGFPPQTIGDALGTR